MKPGDLILYTPEECGDHHGSREVGVVLTMSPSGTKASVLWSTETIPLYFAVGELERYPDVFKVVSQ